MVIISAVMPHLFGIEITHINYKNSESQLSIIISFDRPIQYSVQATEKKTKILLNLLEPVENPKTEIHEYLTRKPVELRKVWSSYRDRLLTIELVPDFKVLEIQQYFISKENDLFIYLKKSTLPEKMRQYDVKENKYILAPVDTLKKFGSLDDFVYNLNNKMPHQARRALKNDSSIPRHSKYLRSALLHVSLIADYILSEEESPRKFALIARKLKPVLKDYKSALHSQGKQHNHFTPYLDFWQAQAYLKAQQYYEARTILEDLEKNSPSLIYQFGASVMLAELLYEKGEYSPAYQKIKATYRKYRRLSDKEQKAISIYAQEYPFFPDSFELDEAYKHIPYDISIPMLFRQEYYSEKIVPFIKIPTAFKLISTEHPEFLYLNPSIFEYTAKNFFRFKDYDKASELAQSYLHIFPISKNTITGSFMLIHADCLRKLGKTNLSKNQYARIMDMFYMEELDLFSRMRLAKQKSSMNIPDRLKEANYIYETVARDFKTHELAEIALHNKGMNLNKLDNLQELLVTYWDFRTLFPKSKEDEGFSKLAIDSYVELVKRYSADHQYSELWILFDEFYNPYLNNRIPYNTLLDISQTFYGIYSYKLSYQSLSELLSLLKKSEQTIELNRKTYEKALCLDAKLLYEMKQEKALEVILSFQKDLSSPENMRCIKMVLTRIYLKQKDYPKCQAILTDLKDQTKQMNSEQREKFFSMQNTVHRKQKNWDELIKNNDSLVRYYQKNSPNRKKEQILTLLMENCKLYQEKEDRINLGKTLKELEKYEHDQEIEELILFYKKYIEIPDDDLLIDNTRYHKAFQEFDQYLDNQQPVLDALLEDTSKR